MQAVTVDGQEALFIPQNQAAFYGGGHQAIQINGQQAFITPTGQIVRAPATNIIPANLIQGLNAAGGQPIQIAGASAQAGQTLTIAGGPNTITFPLAGSATTAQSVSSPAANTSSGESAASPTATSTGSVSGTTTNNTQQVGNMCGKHSLRMQRIRSIQYFGKSFHPLQSQYLTTIYSFK